jgi:hypothetical protein
MTTEFVEKCVNCENSTLDGDIVYCGALIPVWAMDIIDEHYSDQEDARCHDLDYPFDSKNVICYLFAKSAKYKKRQIEEYGEDDD